MGAALPLVITSLNPFARLNHQLRCLSAWKALGFEVLTFNVPDEIDRLRAAGVADADMLPADPSETGLAQHGKPVPRVGDLLARIAHLHPGRPLLLVNADIYPAAASPGFVWSWLDQAPVVALTREETISIGSYTALMHTPYRGGLDIFAIRAGMVPALLAELDRWPVRDRMCFGIPGWDFLLGAIIRRPEIGGIICDSGLLLHVWHPTTYAGVTEFTHYLPAMQALTGSASDTAADAAYVFHRQIVRDCEAGSSLRRQVKGGFLRLPALGQPILPRAVEVARDIRALAPGLCWNLNLAVLARLIEAVVDRPDIPLAITLPMFASAGDRVQLPDLLAACLMHLQCRTGGAVTSDYPANNLHGRALQIVLENTAADPEARLVEVARLFCTELADYGIFNPRLFNWIALSCRNETERSLLRAIRSRALAPDLADAA